MPKKGDQIRSDQISRSVMSDSLRPHESQHARPPCPSPTPGVHWDSDPSSRWCHPAISPSVVPFSSCPESLPASESFPVRQLFAWGGQSTGVSAPASFLPNNTQDWSLEWTGISLQSKGLSRVFSYTTVQKHQFFGAQPSSPCMKVESENKSLSRVWLPATPWTAAYQAPPSMGFSGQQYWSGVPLPSPSNRQLKEPIDSEWWPFLSFK